MKEKICSRCGFSKPLSEFHRRRHYTRSGYRAACKACTRERNLELGVHQRLAEAHTSDGRKKRRVRDRTRSAVQRGSLNKGPCCEGCGVEERIQAHHPDYDDPQAHLAVVWLCPLCHAKEHGTREWTRQMELRFSLPRPQDDPHRAL